MGAWYDAHDDIKRPKLLNIGINDVYVEHGSVEVLQKLLKIDEVSAAEKIKAQYKRIV